MRKNKIRLTESQLHNMIKKSIKSVLKENYDLENDIVSTLTKIRDEINIFLKNYQNGNQGDYQMNIESDTPYYERCIDNLKNAFEEFKDLCTDDWVDY